MWEQTLQFIFYMISKNIPKKPKSRFFFQQRHHSGAHLDSGSLSQLLHDVVLRYRDVALPALLPNGAGEGRVGVSGQKDPQSQADPDSAAGLLDAHHLLPGLQLLQQGHSSRLDTPKFAEQI